MEVYRGLPEGTLVQLINNRLYLYSSHTDAHQSLLGDILMKLGNHVENNKVGRLLMGPFDVYLDKQNAFQPDLIFALPENRHKFRNDGFYGAPDLVIEVLEASTRRLDTGKKKAFYERSGVKEYWLVDPLTKETEGFWLVNGEYEPLPTEEGKLSLRLFNYTLAF